MNIFNDFFGNKQSKDTRKLDTKDTFISTEANIGHKIIRPLTEEQKDKIEKSTILLNTGQLYMHYWSDNLVCTDRNDPEWQNKVMFFWFADEPFPKKSLPPHFELLKVKNFLFQGDTSKISMEVGEAMPWFGMPGLGEKHVCKIDGEKITIPELHEIGLVEYIKEIELTNDNLDILTNKEDYMFLVDEKLTPFYNGNFYLDKKIIPIHIAYSIGGIHIIKRTTLEK